MAHPYQVKPNSKDATYPFMVIFTLRTWNNVKGTYKTEQAAKQAAARWNKNYLSA